MSTAFSILAVFFLVALVAFVMWMVVSALVYAICFGCEDLGSRDYRGKRAFRPDRRWFT